MCCCDERALCKSVANWHGQSWRTGRRRRRARWGRHRRCLHVLHGCTAQLWCPTDHYACLYSHNRSRGSTERPTVQTSGLKPLAMGRGLRACCFTARPDATISFKEAADAAQQPEAGHRESSACWGDVLGLLPPDGPTKDGAVPQDASKVCKTLGRHLPPLTPPLAAPPLTPHCKPSPQPQVSPFPEGIAEGCIPAGTYTTAAAAAAEQPPELGPADSEPVDDGAPQRSSPAAEERQPDAAPSTEWRDAQPCSLQGEQDSLEADVAAALGLSHCAPAGGGSAAAASPRPPARSSSTAAAASPRPAARCSSAAHLSLQLQVAEALGDLQAAQDAVVGAGAAVWPAQHAAGGEGLVRSPSLARSPSGSTAGLSSPWRTSTSSFAAEPEASKRFSCEQRGGEIG